MAIRATRLALADKGCRLDQFVFVGGVCACGRHSSATIATCRTRRECQACYPRHARPLAATVLATAPSGVTPTSSRAHLAGSDRHLWQSAHLLVVCLSVCLPSPAPYTDTGQTSPTKCRLYAMANLTITSSTTLARQRDKHVNTDGFFSVTMTWILQL